MDMHTPDPPRVIVRTTLPHTDPDLILEVSVLFPDEWGAICIALRSPADAYTAGCISLTPQLSYGEYDVGHLKVALHSPTASSFTVGGHPLGFPPDAHEVRSFSDWQGPAPTLIRADGAPVDIDDAHRAAEAIRACVRYYLSDGRQATAIRERSLAMARRVATSYVDRAAAAARLALAELAETPDDHTHPDLLDSRRRAAQQATAYETRVRHIAAHLRLPRAAARP